MYGYPNYRGFQVRRVDIHGDRQLLEFLQTEVRRYFPDAPHLANRLQSRLSPETIFLTAQRGRLRIVVAEQSSMAAYDRLLIQIDELTDARSLREVDALN